MADKPKFWTPFGDYDPNASKEGAEQVGGSNPFLTLDEILDPVVEANASKSGLSFDTVVKAPFSRPDLAQRWGHTPLCLSGLFKKRDGRTGWLQRRIAKDKAKHGGPNVSKFQPATAMISKDQKDYTGTLADNVMNRIFSFLEERDLLHCCAVSQRWKHLAGSGEVWKQRYTKHFGLLEITHLSFNQTVAWKEEPQMNEYKRAFWAKTKEIKAATSSYWFNYQKNEVYIDVVEKYQVVIGNNGQVKSADVVGKVLARCFFTQPQRCELWTNISDIKNIKGEKVESADVSFHSCVDVNGFLTRSTKVTFLPPSALGFHLMRYRFTNQEKVLPFLVTAVYMRDIDKNSYQIEIFVKAVLKDPKIKPTVLVRAPVPPHTGSKIKASIGTADLVTKEGLIYWTIPSLDSSKNAVLSVSISTAKGAPDWVRPPLLFDWEPIPTSLSGFKIVSLQLANKQQKMSNVWVRYWSESGSFRYEV